jgi:hypothetical protein
MPEASLEWATSAMNFARKLRKAGSNNKRSTTKEDVSPEAARERRERRKKVDEELPKVRAGAHSRTDDIDATEHWANYALRAAEAGVGNCNELAAVAMFYLAAHKVLPLWLVGITDPGDHEFLALGSFGDRVVDGAIAEPLEAWPEGVFVCDPWAHIACRARDYKTKWQDQMRKWNEKRKVVLFGGGWIDPLRDDWYTSIVAHPRKIDFYIVKDTPERMITEIKKVFDPSKFLTV